MAGPLPGSPKAAYSGSCPGRSEQGHLPFERSAWGRCISQGSGCAGSGLAPGGEDSHEECQGSARLLSVQVFRPERRNLVGRFLQQLRGSDLSPLSKAAAGAGHGAHQSKQANTGYFSSSRVGIRSWRRLSSTSISDPAREGPRLQPELMAGFAGA